MSRAQALASGLSVRQVVWRVSSGRWVRLYPGVFLTQPGRDDRRSANSAAVLACGSGAVLSHWSVAHGLGLTRAVPKLVHVSVPLTRRVVEPPGVVVHRTVGAVDASQAWQWPPRTSVEQTVIDVAGLGAADDAVAIAALACQRGVTWHEALGAELDRRGRHPWREVLSEALDDIGGGSHSALEVRFVRDVVRAQAFRHREPSARRVPGRTTRPSTTRRCSSSSTGSPITATRGRGRRTVGGTGAAPESDGSPCGWSGSMLRCTPVSRHSMWVPCWRNAAGPARSEPAAVVTAWREACLPRGRRRVRSGGPRGRGPARRSRRPAG